MAKIDWNQSCPNCQCGADESHVAIQGDSPYEQGATLRVKVRVCIFCRTVYGTFEKLNLAGVVGKFTALPVPKKEEE